MKLLALLRSYLVKKKVKIKVDLICFTFEIKPWKELIRKCHKLSTHTGVTFKTPANRKHLNHFHETCKREKTQPNTEYRNTASSTGDTLY